MDTNSAHDPILITFPPSLDSELSRFLVEHYGIRHQERPHALVFSSFVTLWHAGTVVFPLLYSKSFRLAGPRAITKYFDTRCAPDLRLWPQQGTQKRRVDSDWTTFNQTLAFATARFAYYHLLPHRDLMIRPLSLGTPGFERKTVEVAYPVFSGLLQTLLWLTAKRARESLDDARKILDQVDARLTTGAQYLVGDRLTLSDLAFAVAAAPVVLPAAYGGLIPSYDQMPSPIQDAVNELRPRPAGAFALRIYQEQRKRFGQAA
jgi:glutathione S-transferase